MISTSTESIQAAKLPSSTKNSLELRTQRAANFYSWLSSITHLLALAHDNESEVRYSIEQSQTPEQRPTGGYEIHLSIIPPCKEQENNLSNQVLDADAAYYHELGEELYKKTIPFLNDILARLLTISISLSGGSIFFLGDTSYPKGMKVTATILFLLAFITSFVGIIPYRASISYNIPDEVKKTVHAAIWWKDVFIYGAATFIVLGICAAIIGAFLSAHQ